MISDEFPYYNPNLAARALLSPEQLNNPASYPPGFDVASAQLFTDLGEQASKVDELITTLKAQ
jgi:spermidine/putrescine transport system permease protein